MSRYTREILQAIIQLPVQNMHIHTHTHARAYIIPHNLHILEQSTKASLSSFHQSHTIVLSR